VTLNLRQILHDLQDEKEALDETIAALERLLLRQRKSGRMTLAESVMPLQSEKRANASRARDRK
jgi:hypothetical protein